MFFIEIIATHQLIDIAKVSDAIAVSKTRDSQQREAATIAVNANIGVKSPDVAEANSDACFSQSGA
jgi:hypothetical protein